MEPRARGRDVLPVCRELGIGVVPFSPLGRGFLTGDITSPDDFAADDFRRGLPRFQGENFQRNLDLVARDHEARRCPRRHAGAARAGLAARPGRRRRADPRHEAHRTGWPRTSEPIDHRADPEELQRIDEIAPVGAAAGDRYTDMSWVNR